MDLGGDIHSFRRTCADKMFAELKKDLTCEGLVFKFLAEKVLSELLEVRIFTAKVTI